MTTAPRAKKDIVDSKEALLFLESYKRQSHLEIQILLFFFYKHKEYNLPDFPLFALARFSA